MDGNTLGLWVNVGICLAGPLGLLLALALRPRWRRYLPAYALGALTFLVCQVLLRLPLLSFLHSIPSFSLFTLAQPVLYCLLLGFSAGLFEGMGRYATLRFLMKNHRSFADGVFLGLGHGCFEAFILVGLGNISLLLQGGLPPETSVSLILAAGFERVFTILFHVGASVMVLQAVNHRRPLWLVLAILLHGGMDSGIILLQGAGLPVWGLEACIAACGLGMFCYTLYIYKTNKHMGEVL